MNQGISHRTRKQSGFSDRYLTEVSYHKNFRPLIVFAALPIFVFFIIYEFLRDNIFLGTAFILLTVNAVVSLLWARQAKDIQKLTRINSIGFSIAFSLLALVIAGGLFGKDIYEVIPWVFTYPAVILLLLGERIGMISATIYTLMIICILAFLDLPPWSEVTRSSFKLHMALALVALLIYTLIAERSRVKMRNSLIKARNKHKASEERQRLTNEDLKNEIIMRVKSEKALSQSEIRYRALFEESAVSLWEEDQTEIKEYLDNLLVEDVDNLESHLNQNRHELKKCINLARITAVNRATLKLYEAPDTETLMQNIKKILPPDMVDWQIKRIAALYRDGIFESQLETMTINGHKLTLLLTSTVPVGYEATWEKVYTSIFDITDRVAMEEKKKRFEEQLQQTRQIQAIASLAGGIAHQFNNALAIISGNVELLELKTSDVPDISRHFKTLKGTSERMQHLTEQLLAYARGGKYQPIDFALKKLLHTILSPNNGLAKSDATIETNFADDVILSKCDLTQMKIALEAVINNALEATQADGKITINTCTVHLPQPSETKAMDLPPGHYARITVTDNGVGMDEESRRRVFEPFFSTKFVGRGLGMAAAYGIVDNHGGLIQVASEQGKGTRVEIILPCSAVS